MIIQPYKKGDEQEILKLFQLSFGKLMTIEYWRWRFLNNPFHNKVQIHLMWEDNLLVGHYAVSPVNFLLDKHEVLCALSMTTMTHPNFGGRGIFSALATSLYKQLEDDGFQFVWGFPNTNSHYGFIKNLGWKDIGVIPMLSLSTNNFKPLSNVNYTLLYSFNENTAMLLADNTPVAISKSPAYLNWRYVQNPTFHYKILQTQSNTIVVYKKIASFHESSAFEVDIMELNNELNLDTLNEALNAIIQEEGNIAKFNIWISLHEKNYALFEKIGFKQTLPLTYLGFRSFAMPNNTLSDFRNWNFSMGYSDVF